MIYIYTKTKKEIEKEQVLNNCGAQIAKGVPNQVCPTYVIAKNGFRVDTCDLSSDDIIALITDDLKDPETRGAHAFKLLKVLRGSWKPTYDDVIKLYQLLSKYGHIIRDIMGTLDLNIVRDAYTIARFQKQTSGDFTGVTAEDELAVIRQMKQNEIARQSSNPTQR